VKQRPAADGSMYTPVLVVGGGPVGLATALELAHHGTGCIVVEPRTEVSWLRPRAKTTSTRTMEHFRRWGIADTVRRRAPIPQSWSDEVVFCTTLLGREVTRFDHCLGLDLIDDDLVAEGGQQAPQPLIESIMRDRVAQLPATQLLVGRRFVAMSQDDSGVVATIADDSDNLLTIRADYLVGCDGSRSAVREAIGATYEGSADERPNFNIVFRADSLASRMHFGDAVHYWVLNPGQPGLVGRLNLVDEWWCVVMGVSAEQGAADPERLIHNLIGLNAEGVEPVPIEVLATDPWRARMQVADTFRSGRVFLAGDAAHQNPPWGGHGFNTGIGDAANIGWKLSAVLNGWGSETLLESYEVERRPVAVETIAVATKNMSTLGPQLADPRLMGSDAEFASAQPIVAAATQRHKRAEFHSLDLVLGTSYADSPVVVAERAETEFNATAHVLGEYVPSAAPGNRLPHTWLAKDRSLYDTLGSDYSLVGEVNHPAAHQLLETAASLHIPLSAVELDCHLADKLFAAPLVLVRPDQHVAWRGERTSDPESLLRTVSGRA
jgi:2-polyprenyl-6-methoxyphenol hydroxylase-like FAD-dependent oxidoreductase